MEDSWIDLLTAVLYTAVKILMLPFKLGMWLIRVAGPKGYRATQNRLRALVESDEQVRCTVCANKACKGCPVQNAKDVLEGGD